MRIYQPLEFKVTYFFVRVNQTKHPSYLKSINPLHVLLPIDALGIELLYLSHCLSQ